MQNRIVRGLAAGAMALAALSACTAPGTAGSVNGVAISEKQVDELAAAIKDNGGVVSTRGSLVSLLQLNEVLSKIAEQITLPKNTVSGILSACSRSYPFVGTGENVPDAVRNFCIVQFAAQSDESLRETANKAIDSLDLGFSSRYGEVKDGKITTPEYLQPVSSSK